MTCCIRPEHITLTKTTDPAHSSARNTIRDRIVNIQVPALFFKILPGCGFCLNASVTRLSMDVMCL